MADFPQYPATSFDQAVDLTIFASNQLGDVINGDALSSVDTETGQIPTLRKALVDNFFFKSPIPWVQGTNATVFNQLYYFYESNTNNGWYYAPGATTTNPVLMGVTPVGDANWRLYSVVSQNTPAEVFPFGQAVLTTISSITPPHDFDTAIVTFNGVTLTDRDYSVANNTIIFNTPLEPDLDSEFEDYLFCYLGRVQQGNSSTNYVNYPSLATTGLASGATLVGTSSGNNLQEVLNSLYLSFEEGGTLLDAHNQILDTSTNPNQAYRWDGSLPKVVPAGSTPASSGGIGSGAWVAIGDSTLLSEISGPQGSWLVGKSSNLQDLLAYSVKEGFLYATDGYYTPGDGGGATYLISSTSGSIPELATLCGNGKYAILQHNGRISLEQLGAKGVSIGLDATEDSWDAFYLAYKIKLNSTNSISFVLGKSGYYVSKPIPFAPAMKITTTGSPWRTQITYGGGSVTTAQFPNSAPPADASSGPTINWSTIRACCIVVNPTGNYNYYSTLKGVIFKVATTVTTPVDYAIFAPYASKLYMENLRTDKTLIGLRSQNLWNSTLRGCIFGGMDTSVAAPAGSIGVSILGGTSNIYEIVGTSGFETGYKITLSFYSTFNSCYSEKGNNIACEFNGCRGITVNGFGLEGLANTAAGVFRHYDSSVDYTSITFASNNNIGGGYVITSQNSSRVSLENLDMRSVANTGSTISLLSIDAAATMSIGHVFINPTLLTSVGIVSGALISPIKFSGAVGIANGSGTTNAVTFTTNDVIWRYTEAGVFISMDLSWTGGSGTDLQIFGLPKVATRTEPLNSLTGNFGHATVANTIAGTSRIRLANAATLAFETIPATGTLRICGTYSYN